MSTPESNDRSISQLKGDVINGDNVLGGGKAAPVVIDPVSVDDTMDLSVPTVLSADGGTDSKAGDSPIAFE